MTKENIICYSHNWDKVDVNEYDTDNVIIDLVCSDCGEETTEIIDKEVYFDE